MRIPENFCYYLSLAENCGELELARANGFSSLDLETSPQTEALKLRKMVNSVLAEIHRMKAFVRLQPKGGRILYGYFKPRHNIGSHVCGHFARRNPGIIVILGNGRESWVSLFANGSVLQDHGKGLSETLQRLEPLLRGSGDSDGQCNGKTYGEGCNVNDLWQIYYDSQFCPERKNPQSFRQKMPRKDQNAAGLGLVQKKKGMTLDDFL